MLHGVHQCLLLLYAIANAIGFEVVEDTFCKCGIFVVVVLLVVQRLWRTDIKALQGFHREWSTHANTLLVFLGLVI